MEKDVRVLAKPEELLAWTHEHRRDIEIDFEDAEILLNMMKQKGYQAGVHALGKMVRVDADGKVEDYSLDEMIDDVCEWNFIEITEADEGRRKASNFIAFINAQATYMKLQRTEQVLDRLFDQTAYGKQLKETAYQLAMSLVKRAANEEELEECVEELVSGIKEYTTDKKGR